MARRSTLRVTCAGVLSLILPAGHLALADVGGEHGPVTRYVSPEFRRSENKEDLEFSVELDDVAFPLTTWQGKYRLVRVRIFNPGKTPITFSSEKDSVQAHVQGQKISADLIPSETVPELWDKLDAETRKKIAYPKALAPDHTIHVYLLFPSDKLAQTPAGFSWSIASLNKTVSIHPPRVALR